MPDIATLHPQVVHFVIALAFVGVGARIASLLPLGPRFSFAGPMAALLIIFSAGAGVVAEQSGDDAHPPAERVPGARTAVQEHEDAGKLARNVLLALALIEIVGLALAGKPKAARGLRFVSALAGIGACAAVFEAAEHGGDLVYNYAGGIGIRSGDTADVRHLLVAGLYHNTVRARAAGQKADAARYVNQLVIEMPNDTSVRFMGVESLIKDQDNPRAALALLGTMTMPDGSRFQTRRAMLTADAYAAAGVPDSARLTLEALKAKVGDNPRALQQVDDALAKLTSAH